MWTPDVLVRWLTGLNVAVTGDDTVTPLTPMAGPYIPERPNRVVVATLLPGAGTLREDLFDQPAMQLFIRGDQNDLSGQSTAVIAKAYDEAVLFGATAANSTVVDDQRNRLGRLVGVQRAGGAPASSGPPDNAQRVEMTATYVLQIATF